MPPGPGILDHQPELHAFVRLQADDQPVRLRSRRRSSSKIECGIGAEGDDDLGDALGQPLAGAQIERHAGPAPVVDLRLQRDEGLGVARLVADLLEVARHRAARRSRRRDTGRARVSCVDVRCRRSASARAAPSASRRARRRRRCATAAPSRPGRAAAACGSAPCRAARRRARSRRRGPRRRALSATVICTWSMCAAFHSGSNSALPKRSAIRFCTVSLPR